jgi:hypothetical protein
VAEGTQAKTAVFEKSTYHELADSLSGWRELCRLFIYLKNDKPDCRGSGGFAADFVKVEAACSYLVRATVIAILLHRNYHFTTSGSFQLATVTARTITPFDLQLVLTFGSPAPKFLDRLAL